MSPIAKAARVFIEEPSAVDFQDVLASHLLYGYVYSTPESFIMARPVNVDASHKEILDSNVDFANPNAWFIYAAAGTLESFLAIEPYPLPFFGWEKRNRVRFWPRERVINAIRAPSSHLLGCPIS